MSEDLLKQSIEIIQGMSEKYLTEGHEPQLEVIIIKSRLLVSIQGYKRENG